jgi:hypothetical protein
MSRRRLSQRPSLALRTSVATICAIPLVAAICLGQQPPKRTTPQLILLDGSSIAFQSLEISAGKLSGEGVPALVLDDLRKIDLAAPTAAADKPAVIAELRGGGRISARKVSIGNDKCQLDWAIGDPLSVPLDMIRAVRFDPQTANSEFEKAVAAPSAELDRVLIKDDAGKLTTTSGLVDSLDEQQLSLEVSGRKTNIPRERLFGIAVAQPVAMDAPPHCLAAFRDGSQLGGESLAISGDQATLGFPTGGQARFPWAAVASVTIRSSRVAYLSELKPITDEQQAIVTLPRPWQRDKSVTGQPLKLGTRVFEKGLGVHARSLLTFAADKKWDTLAATLGLDAAADGQGDCVFHVLADGQPLLSRRMRSSDSPYEIQLSITGREQITLLVEPGEGLDLADHADWCDARFIKNRP